MKKMKTSNRFHFNSKNFCLMIHDTRYCSSEFLEYFKNKIFRIKYNKLEYHEYVNYICICSTNEGIYILLQFSKKVQVKKKSFFEIVLNNELIEATCFTARDTDLIKNEMMLLDDFIEHGNYKSNSQRVIQHLRFLDKK